MFRSVGVAMHQFGQAEKRLDASDVVALLREVYPEGVRGRNEAEALIAFDREFPDPAPEWHGFVAEAVADHLLHRSQPYGILTNEKASWLMRTLAPAGIIATRGGVQILIRTMELAGKIPASFSAFAIRALWREARVLEAGDSALLRRILEAGQGAISAEEAEALFDLHDTVAGARNHASFDEVFFRAISLYLLAASGRETLSRKEALSREPQRNICGGIGGEPAAWLASRIMRDGQPTFAERALLGLINYAPKPNSSVGRSIHRAA